MTDLRALLGDQRYAHMLGNAYTAFRSRLIFNTAPNAIVADALDRALAAVLPDLLAAAWDEGRDEMLAKAARFYGLQPHEAEFLTRKTPNPYRTKETDHA